MKRVAIIGAGGFGREVAWIVERINRAGGRLEVIGFCDDAPEKQTGMCGRYPLLGRIENVDSAKAELFFCAIGDNQGRKKVTERAVAIGLRPLTLIDPSAQVAPDAVIGEGGYIGILSVVSSGAHIGRGALVNHHVTVGHDAVLGEFAQLCPGVRVSGGSRLDDGVLMGSNACTIPGRHVGAWATVGAGATVVRDIEPGGGVIRFNRM